MHVDTPPQWPDSELYWTRTKSRTKSDLQHIPSSSHRFTIDEGSNTDLFWEHKFWESRCENLWRVRVIWDLSWAARQLLAPAGVPLGVVFGAGRAAALVGRVEASSVWYSALGLCEKKKSLLNFVLHTHFIPKLKWAERTWMSTEQTVKTENAQNVFLMSLNHFSVLKNKLFAILPKKRGLKKTKYFTSYVNLYKKEKVPPFSRENIESLFI